MNDNNDNQAIADATANLLTDEQMDQLAADEQAFDDMMERNRARRLMADTVDIPVQPKVTDFTEIVASVIKDGEYAVRILLDSGEHVKATPWVCRQEAERLEIIIGLAMIEYRTKMNKWERDWVEYNAR